MAIDDNEKRTNVLSVMSPVAAAVLPIPAASIGLLARAQLVHISGVVALGIAVGQVLPGINTVGTGNVFKDASVGSGGVFRDVNLDDGAEFTDVDSLTTPNTR